MKDIEFREVLLDCCIKFFNPRYIVFADIFYLKNNIYYAII